MMCSLYMNNKQLEMFYLDTGRLWTTLLNNTTIQTFTLKWNPKYLNQLEININVKIYRWTKSCSNILLKTLHCHYRCEILYCKFKQEYNSDFVKFANQMLIILIIYVCIMIYSRRLRISKIFNVYKKKSKRFYCM